MKQHYQGLGHIAVYTADMDASIAFYEKIGGSLHLRAPACSPEQQRELALVEFGGFLVELIAAPVPEGAGCIPHFAVYVDDVDRGSPRRRRGHLPDRREVRDAQHLRRVGELVLHWPLRGTDRTFEDALSPLWLRSRETVHWTVSLFFCANTPQIWKIELSPVSAAAVSAWGFTVFRPALPGAGTPPARTRCPGPRRPGCRHSAPRFPASRGCRSRGRPCPSW